MLWAFVIIVVLTASLLIPNALYAVREFVTNRNLFWLTAYFVMLISLGGLVIHVTTRTVQIIQTAHEVLMEPDIEVVRAGH